MLSALPLAKAGGIVDRINPNGVPAVNHHAELTAVRWLLSRLIAHYNAGHPDITLADLHNLEDDLVQMQSEMIVL